MDNSKLEKIMKKDLTAETQKELFSLLNDSQLLMPVSYPENIPDDEDHVGFIINYLSNSNGERAVPLFTSIDVMKSAGIETQTMAIHMNELADLIHQTDKYSVIAINPFTDYDVNIPADAFFNLFKKRFDQKNVHISCENVEITDIRHEKLRHLLNQDDLNDDDIKQLVREFITSTLIAPCVSADDGTSFVLIWDSQNIAHMPLFTDLDEFEKIFSNYSEVFAQAYHFEDLLNVIDEKIVLNPASESFVFSSDMFEKK